MITEAKSSNISGSSSPEEPYADPLDAKVARWGLIVGGLLIVLGIAALSLPGLTALAIDVWLGILLLAASIGFGIHAIQTRKRGVLASDLICAVLYLVGGLLLLLSPRSGIITLALILSLVFIAEGAGRIAFATRASTGRSPVWWIMDGVIAILLGAIIFWYWPGDSAWVVGIVVGVRFIFGGIVAITFASMMRLHA